MQSVNINHFTDYRTFLLAHVQNMKQKKKSWSYGAWAKAMDLKATSSITKIISGERGPGPEITEKLIQYFKFNDKQAQYFRDLIRLEKLKSDPKLSTLLMEKLSRDFPAMRSRYMDDKTFLIISNWYYLALRELCRNANFQEDPEWISERFLFKVNARDISQALKVLLQMGLLERDPSGRLILAESRLETSTDTASEAIKRHHEQMLEHAKTALRKVRLEEREFTSTTLLMSTGQMSEAKELMREFKMKFEKIMEKESGDQVYQFQLQLFPLSKKITKEVSQ
jgi:uncharacterized protein (TIGR02147 family)